MSGSFFFVPLHFLFILSIITMTLCCTSLPTPIPPADSKPEVRDDQVRVKIRSENRDQDIGLLDELTFKVPGVVDWTKDLLLGSV